MKQEKEGKSGFLASPVANESIISSLDSGFI